MFLRLQELHDRIFRFAIRIEHRLLVLRHLLHEAGFLRRDQVADAAIVENIPAERWADVAAGGVREEQVLELAGTDEDLAGDRERRVEVRLSDADEGALLSDQPFLPADVGATANEVSRNAEHHVGRRRRDRADAAVAGQQRLDVLRRHTHQRAETVLRLTQLCFELRDRRFGLGNVGDGLRYVELARYARFLLVFRQPQRT